MIYLSHFLIAFVAFLHLWFMVLECFLWTTPRGMRAFGMNEEKARATKVMAQNQGLYNGFLAAGLIWGLYTGEFRIKVFFLCCVFIAGIVGAVTAHRKILYIQSMPAFLALMVLWYTTSP